MSKIDEAKEILNALQVPAKLSIPREIAHLNRSN